MGEIEVSIGKIMQSPNQSLEMNLSGGGKDSKLIVHGVVGEQKEVAPQGPPKMIDYLRSWKLDLNVAIDFTASNNEEDLHQMGPNNMYEATIMQVGSVLEPYDFDHFWPVFGFGGKPPGESKVSHCFPLTGNITAPCVVGV